MQDDLAELPPQKPMGKGDFRYIPNGVPGVENRMHLMYEGGVVSGHFDMMRFVDLNCTMPAKLFGLYPRKGIIGVGADADIVVWDPNADYTIEAATHHMRVDYNLYEGMKVSGRPSTGDLTRRDHCQRRRVPRRTRAWTVHPSFDAVRTRPPRERDGLT